MSKSKKKKKKKKEKHKLTRKNADKHALYEGAVQDVDDDIKFMQRIFKKHRKRPLHFLREDFCGTAALAARWVELNKKHTALAIDLDPEPLDWGLRYNIHKVGKAGERVKPILANVMDVHNPKAEAACAFNFSYFLFKTRDSLRTYFKSAHRSLKKDGILFMDAFGGMAAMQTNTDIRSITDGKDTNGKLLPTYIYEWEHSRFNVVTHDLMCHIHFEFTDGSRWDKAFTYDWRLWTLPEIQELALEAGFDRVEVYIHGWDKDGESDDKWVLRKHYENEDGWLAYIVAIKDG